MTKQEIQQFIKQAVDAVDMKVQKRIKEYKEESDKKMLKYEQRSDEKMQQYIGALKEDSDHKFQAVFEYVQDIPQIKEDVKRIDARQEMMFDKMGEIVVDVTITKETGIDHEVRITKLEAPHR